MTTLRRDTSAWPELRQSLYAGELFLLPPTAASTDVADQVQALLERELGVSDIRAVHRELSEETFFERIGKVRRALFLEPHWHDVVRRLVAACDVDPEAVAFDPIRLRVISHRGHENPRAKAVYLAHRDTWYAHSQAVVTWWIPLHDLPEEETFFFYPARFTEEVPNDSEVFEYGAWVRDGWDLKIGWQRRDAGLETHYPGVLGEVDPGPAVGFSCRRGENLLFSGAHFHQTREQATGSTRFSLDFRVVDLADHERGVGAPNVDNRSRGSAVVDYVRSPAG